MRIRALVCGLIVLGLTLPAAAQEPPPLELSGGYSLLRVSRGLGVGLADTEQTLHGWYAEAAATQSTLLSLVGQGSGNYGTFEGVSVKVYEFAGGARLNSRMGARVLVRSSSCRPCRTTGLTDQGTKRRSTPAAASGWAGPRPSAFSFGADYEIIFTGGSNLLEPEGGERTHGFRVTAGAAFPIGG